MVTNSIAADAIRRARAGRCHRNFALAVSRGDAAAQGEGGGRLRGLRRPFEAGGRLGPAAHSRFTVVLAVESLQNDGSDGRFRARGGRRRKLFGRALRVCSPRLRHSAASATSRGPKSTTDRLAASGLRRSRGHAQPADQNPDGHGAERTHWAVRRHAHATGVRRYHATAVRTTGPHMLPAR